MIDLERGPSILAGSMPALSGWAPSRCATMADVSTGMQQSAPAAGAILQEVNSHSARHSVRHCCSAPGMHLLR